MEPAELFDEYLDGTVYEGKQVDKQGVHLTAGEIYGLGARGYIDFGGDEHRPRDTRKLEPQKRNPDDDYGWWDLEGGAYRVVFNESVKDAPVPLLLTPNTRLLDCGSFLASCVVEEGQVASILTVPRGGVGIKENARIALLSPLG